MLTFANNSATTICGLPEKPSDGDILLIIKSGKSSILTDGDKVAWTFKQDTFVKKNVTIETFGVDCRVGTGHVATDSLIFFAEEMAAPNSHSQYDEN